MYIILFSCLPIHEASNRIKTITIMAELDRPNSALDNLTRLNLLDIVLERSRNLSKKALVHCLVYVGRLNNEKSNSQQAVADFHEQFFKSLGGGQFQLETITGLLLLYPGHFVHVVEGPENVLRDLINGVCEKGSDLIMKDVKLLVYRNDAPARMFSQWSFRVLNLISVRMDESKNQDTLETKVTEAINLILKLAKELSQFSKTQLKTNLDQLTSKYSSMLPPQDLLESLVKSKDLPLINQYQKKSAQPLQITLDSELVWPIQNILTFVK